MGELMQAVKERRSIRKYLDKEVPEALVKELMEAVRWSPSWANTQCWEWVVVRSAETKGRLADTLPPTNPARKAVAETPVLLALCGKLQSSGYYKGQVTTKFGDWFMFDLGLACQTLCLAAHDLGLGTVVVGLFDHSKAREILSVPEGYELVALIPLGYPAHTPSAPKRREVGDFLHEETF